MSRPNEISEFDGDYRRTILAVMSRVGATARARAIMKFAGKYMLPKELWHQLFVNLGYSWNPYFAFYHFHITENIIFECNLTNLLKLLDWKLSSGEYHLWHLQYPNNNLNNILLNCEYNCDKSLPREIILKYKRMTVLYDNIISVENDSKAWFKSLLHVNDVEFVKHNVEYRLGENLNDKTLWILYINFLKEYDVELMLHTYSKYCRFFTNDKEMRAKYEEVAEEYGPIEVPWDNRNLAYEKHRGRAPKTLVELIRMRNTISRDLTSLKVEVKDNLPRKRKRNFSLHFSYDFIGSQHFSFKKSFIYYIFQTSDHYVRQSLLKSCKFFFSKYPFALCYKLSVTNGSNNGRNITEIVKESIYDASQTTILNLKNLHITTFFNYESEANLSSILKSIYKCTAKSVSIVNTKQKLTLSELMLLIGHENVIYLDFCEVLCTDDETGKALPMEDILRLTPKIQFINIWNPVFSSQTAQILAILPFQRKIRKFWFHSDRNDLEPNWFSEFIVKNFSDNCELKYVRGPVETEFDRIIETTINKKWKGKRKPHIYKEL